MFVTNSMTQKVVTIDKSASIFEAQKLMADHRIRHLPIVDPQGHLLGIVTDRDIRSALPYELFREKDNAAAKQQVSRLTVADIMTANPLTISPMDTIQDALLRIQKERVGAFPVVDEHNVLKGILSVRDLLRAFVNVLNIGEPGTLLCVLVEEKVGQMKRIVDAITGENVSIGSILVARYWDDNMRAVFPYVLTLNTRKVKQKLESIGFKILDPMKWYMDQLPKHD
ncbi:MAG: CBS and ACT domain-containing protein [Pseudomonadota bacterium]